MKSDLVDIDVRIVHETEKAWLLNTGEKEFWIPKSACEVSRKYDAGTGGKRSVYTLTVPEWKAQELELI